MNIGALTWLGVGAIMTAYVLASGVMRQLMQGHIDLQKILLVRVLVFGGCVLLVLIALSLLGHNLAYMVGFR